MNLWVCVVNSQWSFCSRKTGIIWCLYHYFPQVKTQVILKICSNIIHCFLDYVSGGELFTHLYQRERFKECEVRIYIAEIVLALQHLHKVIIIIFNFININWLVKIIFMLEPFGLQRDWKLILQIQSMLLFFIEN